LLLSIINGEIVIVRSRGVIVYDCKGDHLWTKKSPINVVATVSSDIMHEGLLGNTDKIIITGDSTDVLDMTGKLIATYECDLPIHGNPATIMCHIPHTNLLVFKAEFIIQICDLDGNKINTIGEINRAYGDAFHLLTVRKMFVMKNGQLVACGKSLYVF
jgi:hypothetical protein